MGFTKKEQRSIKQRKKSLLSKGEIVIFNYLFKNCLDFYREFYFKEFYKNGNFKLLFFDFYLPGYKVAIEFDGEQHYTLMYRGHKLINQRENDFLKNAFCAKNGIKLLRIKYCDAGKIENIIVDFFDKHFPL